MASLAFTPQSHLFFAKPTSNLNPLIIPSSPSFIKRSKNPNLMSSMVLDRIHRFPMSTEMRFIRSSAVDTTAVVEEGGFVAEMRALAKKLHTREQVKEGEEEAVRPEEKAISTWKPTIEGYLKFLVDSKLVYDILNRVLEEAPFPFYVELRNVGLERSESLVKDLKWFKEEGYSIPKASEIGFTYSNYLEELGHKNPHAFICHLYNVYIGHTAGGHIIGKMVSQKLLNNKELEFYKYPQDYALLVHNTKVKLNKVSQGWTTEDKKHCLEEMKMSFKYAREMFHVILI